jgi:hypothetical protein
MEGWGGKRKMFMCTKLRHGRANAAHVLQWRVGCKGSEHAI